MTVIPWKGKKKGHRYKSKPGKEAGNTILVPISAQINISISQYFNIRFRLVM